MIRTIKKVVKGSIQYDGAGVKLVRVIGNRDTKEFDPFLMLDAFDSIDPEDYIKGFPWHPHRGIETVTYLIQGDIEHGDSLGNKGEIREGCCQWMTAGRGIMHQEMPMPAERMLGVQLWLNLPKKHKMTDPQYRDIEKNSIPMVVEDGALIRVISGLYKDTEGAVATDFVKMQFLDVNIVKNSQWRLKTDPQNKLFIYIVEGEGWFEDSYENIQHAKSALLFNEGDEVLARASENGLRFLLFSAKSLNEPIAWGGPIVMNTEEELEKAFFEINNGDFIR